MGQHDWLWPIECGIKLCMPVPYLTAQMPNEILTLTLLALLIIESSSDAFQVAQVLVLEGPYLLMEKCDPTEPPGQEHWWCTLPKGEMIFIM